MPQERRLGGPEMLRHESVLFAAHDAVRATKLDVLQQRSLQREGWKIEAEASIELERSKRWQADRPLETKDVRKGTQSHKDTGRLHNQVADVAVDQADERHTQERLASVIPNSNGSQIALSRDTAQFDDYNSRDATDMLDIDGIATARCCTSICR